MIIYCTLIFIIAMVLVCYCTEKVIYIAHKKNLFDEPFNERKVHLTRTPRLGGVAIFASLMFTFFLFLPYASIVHLNYIVAASVIIFIIGLTDDLVGVNPTKKFIAQIIVALIITGPAEFRFTHFYGFLGLQEIPYLLSMFLSVMFILLTINAFNLIDGINCLAGGIGLFICGTFAIFYSAMHETAFLFLALAMSGCLAGFLLYNRTPAKIFMGDTGSLFLGFIISIFSIHFIELNKPDIAKSAGHLFHAAPAIVYALLIIPIFDTIRVFALRVLNKKSPFSADRNHIHHRLIELNSSHIQSTCILLLINMAALIIVVIMEPLSNEVIFLIVSAFIIFSNWLLCHRFTRKINAQGMPVLRHVGNLA